MTAERGYDGMLRCPCIQCMIRSSAGDTRCVLLEVSGGKRQGRDAFSFFYMHGKICLRWCTPGALGSLGLAISKSISISGTCSRLLNAEGALGSRCCMILPRAMYLPQARALQVLQCFLAKGRPSPYLANGQGTNHTNMHEVSL